MKTEYIKKEYKKPVFYDNLGSFKWALVINRLLKYIFLLLLLWLVCSIFLHQIKITFEQLQNFNLIHIFDHYIIHIIFVINNISLNAIIHNYVHIYHYLAIVPIIFTIIYIIVSIVMFIKSQTQKKLAKVGLESYRVVKKSRNKIVIKPRKNEEIDYDYFERYWDDFKQEFILDENWIFNRFKTDAIIIEIKKEITNVDFEINKLVNSKFFLGKSITDNKYIQDFFKNFSSLLHIAILGTSGGGKSNFLNLLIINIFYSFNRVSKFIFIDFKGGLESEPYNKIAQKFNLEDKITTIKNDIDKLLETLKEIDTINKNRAETLRLQGLKKWSDQYIYLIFDEFAALLSAEYHTKEERDIQKQCINIINNLFMTGRSQNIRIIYVAQSYVKDSSGINNTIKTNTTTKFLFNTQESTSISSVITQEELEEYNLNPKNLSTGEAIYIGDSMCRFKTPLVSDDIEQIISDVLTHQNMDDIDKLIDIEYQEQLILKNMTSLKRFFTIAKQILKMFFYSFIILLIIYIGLYLWQSI